MLPPEVDECEGEYGLASVDTGDAGRTSTKCSPGEGSVSTSAGAAVSRGGDWWPCMCRGRIEPTTLFSTPLAATSIWMAGFDFLPDPRRIMNNAVLRRCIAPRFFLGIACGSFFSSLMMTMALAGMAAAATVVFGLLSIWESLGESKERMMDRWLAYVALQKCRASWERTLRDGAQAIASYIY